MSLNLALTSAISGLSTAQAGLDVISNNIANVNTAGYTRKIFVPESLVLAGKGAGVQVGDIINNVDQNLMRDARNQNGSVGLLQTLNSYYKRVQDTFGTTGAQNSLSNQINGMQQEFTTLTTSPETTSQQLAAIQAGVDAANNMSSMSQTVQTLRLNADRDIASLVSQMNNDLNTIASLNDQISLGVATKKPTGDLEDKRDVALNSLSNTVDIRYFENANGSVTVYTSDGTTLVDNSPVKMTHVSLSQVSPSATYSGGDFNGIFAGVRDITNSIQGGKLKALIDMRDNTLPTMQAQLDELGASLKNQVNQIHNRGTAFPDVVNNIVGTRNFMSSSTQTVSFSGSEPSIVLYDATGAEVASSRVLDPTGINFTNGGTIDDLAASMQTWIQAQDPQLVNAQVSVDADGHFAVNLGTDAIGVGFQDQQTAIKGSAQKDVTASVDLDGDGTADKSYAGFSNFLGLNDYFTSVPNLAQWTSAYKPANYTLTVAAAADLNFSDASNPTGIAGGTITVNPNDTLEAIAAKINSNAALQSRIKASVVPEGSGKRLQITHTDGEKLVVTQAGGTDAIDALGLDFSNTGLSQKLTVNQPLLDDPSRISRGQPQLDPLTGKYVLAAGDNSVVSQLANLMTGAAAFDPAGSLSGASISFADYASSIISLSSSAAASTATNLSTQEALQTSLTQKQSEKTGVNLDEEMSQLLIYQQSYAASAKVISTTQQLLQILNDIIK
ncbi:MAG: flagellar hook-associated protein FlgK [Rhodospirillaceae bacterium]